MFEPEPEEENYLKKDEMNAASHFELELRAIYVSVSLCVIIALIYIIFKSMRSYARSQAAEKRNERIDQLP